jgi:hypothetical protein
MDPATRWKEWLRRDAPFSSLLKNLILRGLFKKVQMQGGARGAD